MDYLHVCFKTKHDLINTVTYCSCNSNCSALLPTDENEALALKCSDLSSNC